MPVAATTGAGALAEALTLPVVDGAELLADELGAGGVGDPGGTLPGTEGDGDGTGTDEVDVGVGVGAGVGVLHGLVGVGVGDGDGLQHFFLPPTYV